MAKRITRYASGAECRLLPPGEIRVEYSDPVSAHEHRREMTDLGFVETGSAMSHGPHRVDVYYRFEPKEKP